MVRPTAYRRREFQRNTQKRSLLAQKTPAGCFLREFPPSSVRLAFRPTVCPTIIRSRKTICGECEIWVVGALGSWERRAILSSFCFAPRLTSVVVRIVFSLHTELNAAEDHNSARRRHWPRGYRTGD